MVVQRKPPAPNLDSGAESVPPVSPEFLEALGVAVYTTDADGIITSFNEAAAELWGRRPEIGVDQWCGSWRIYTTDGKPLPHAECPMGITLKENRTVRGGEAIAERPDGTRVWFAAYPTPLRDADGTLVGAVNVLLDVTDQRRAEKDASYLSAIIASSDDAIVSKDLDGFVTSWNAGAERVFGFKAEEMLGKSIRTIIPPDRQSEEDDVLARVRRGDPVEHFETMRRRKDGREIPVSLTVSPVRGRDGKIIGASKIARDITERREAERAIEEALAVKDDFIGLVSHELRTPVTTILGNAQILARRDSTLDEEERRAAIGDVHQEAVRLNRIIEDLLALARADGSKIECEPVSLTRAVEKIVRGYGERAAPGVELRIDAEKSPIVLSEENLITQVLTNYLSNAAKYSPPNSAIDVIVDANETAARVRVLDRGIGIDPDEANHLFDTFYRSKNVGSISGMGIGLSVCQRLVSAVGGECWAAPREGGGSEFGFSLPIYVPS